MPKNVLEGYETGLSKWEFKSLRVRVKEDTVMEIYERIPHQTDFGWSELRFKFATV